MRGVYDRYGTGIGHYAYKLQPLELYNLSLLRPRHADVTCRKQYGYIIVLSTPDPFYLSLVLILCSLGS